MNARGAGKPTHFLSTQFSLRSDEKVAASYAVNFGYTDMAQAGGPDGSKAEEALAAIETALRDKAT